MRKSERQPFGPFKNNLYERDLHPHPESHWSPDFFNQYLLGLTRGENFLLPVSEYPKTIQMHDDWHEVLNSMRLGTQQDGHERLSLIAYKPDRRGIFLPTTGVKGERSKVPAKTIQRGREYALNQQRMAGFIGDIHSHPPGYHGIAFSSTDLYRLVSAAESEMYVCGLIENDLNMFAFASGQTRSTFVPKFMSQESFSTYWNNKTRKDTPFERFSRGNGWGTRMNKEIATRHQLVLYKGVENGILTQVSLDDSLDRIHTSFSTMFSTDLTT